MDKALVDFKAWEKDIVIKAQAGDMDAIDELMAYIMSEKGNVVWTIARQNTQHDRSRDDFEQEFLIGCYKAIEKAKADSSPIGFIVQKGIWQMQTYLRSGYKKALVQHCQQCNSTTRPLTKHGFVVCPKCNNSTVGTLERFEFFTPVDYSDSESKYQHIPANTVTEEDIAEEAVISEFEARLTGRVLDVFRLMIREEINRDTSKNYIKEIAGRLDITTSNVNLRLRTIKKKWAEFMEEQEADLMPRPSKEIVTDKIVIEEEN